MSSDRVLVAGVGNIFLGDDGFGVEVVRRLAGKQLPDGVQVSDFGIRGVHLAYELLDGARMVIIVDAMPRNEKPGTVTLMEVIPGTAAKVDMMDAHDMSPDTVLGLLDSLGGQVDRVLVVGCEPAELNPGIGLSEPVAAAVDEAVRIVCGVLADEPASPAEVEAARAEQR